MSYKIGICDDEILQIKINSLYLKEIAQKYKYDLEYHAFSTGKKLRTYLETNSLDVLFLDIDLGDETGIGIASWLAKEYPDMIIIFVTGHREFAEEAFEVEAVGYLVKPFDISKMENVLRKVMVQLSEKSAKEETEEIIITEENLKKKIVCKDVLYVERQQARSIIKTVQKEYQVYETITSLCERLGDSFIRINQGEVVNIKLIKESRGNTVYLKDGKQITIGRTYRKDVTARYFG